MLVPISIAIFNLPPVSAVRDGRWPRLVDAVALRGHHSGYRIKAHVS